MTKRNIMKLDMIFNHFGMEHQIKKFKEEVKEYLESEELEEIADIYVLVNQLYMNDKMLRKLVEHKINRTLNRIAEGYYNKETI